MGGDRMEANQRGLWDAYTEEMEGWIEERLGETGGSFQGGSVYVFPPYEAKAWREKMSKGLAILPSIWWFFRIKKICALPKEGRQRISVLRILIWSSLPMVCPLLQIAGYTKKFSSGYSSPLISRYSR